MRRDARRAPCGRRPAARQTARERERQVARVRRARHGGRYVFRGGARVRTIRGTVAAGSEGCCLMKPSCRESWPRPEPESRRARWSSPRRDGGGEALGDSVEVLGVQLGRGAVATTRGIERPRLCLTHPTSPADEARHSRDPRKGSVSGDPRPEAPPGRAQGESWSGLHGAASPVRSTEFPKLEGE